MENIFSDREKERYSRNMLIDEWKGAEGQEKLKRSRVLVVGAGGSGSPLLYYLTAAGVGSIKVVDGDHVELSNLNRQILHNELKIGMNKAESARETLKNLNSNIEIISCPLDINDDNVASLAGDCDIICCAADERGGRAAYKALNKFASRAQKPVSWAGGVYMGGFATFLNPPQTPCMECLLAFSDEAVGMIKDGKIEKPDDVAKPREGPNPIIGAAAGTAGSIQAMETIKFLVGFGRNLANQMLLFQMGDEIFFNTYDISNNRVDGCPYCSRR